MMRYYTISLMAVITQASAISSSSFDSGLDGWYPCSDFTFAADESSDQDAECAVYSAPLCYPGICEAPENVDPTVDIFVKRIPAVSDQGTASNVWLLQGGPGYASTALESAMEEIHSRLNGTVNVYTMDYRGTGRSTLLECLTAHFSTVDFSSRFATEVSKVPACARALKNRYGDLSFFSVTSAATDVATFISDCTNGANTIVYSVSYGTTVAERLMHLNPPEVTGYVLDGVATTSGVPRDKTKYTSRYDINVAEMGDAFLALCATAVGCSERFLPNNLSVTLQDVITQFDDNPNSTCAALVSKMYSEQSSDPASYILRRALGNLLELPRLRSLIPPVVYRLNRCEPKDIDVLTYFFWIAKASFSSPSDDSAFTSNLLFYLISFSESWEKPEPSISEMTLRFTNTKMSGGGVYTLVPFYCAFSKEKSAACDQLDVGSYDANGIIYEVDKYWNKSAVIPPQANVLLMNGKLDPQTSYKYAESLLEALDGVKKELILFDFAPHGILLNTELGQGNETCGMKILLSYVINDGDLELLDKSCVDEMPAFSMIPLLAHQHYFLSTDDLYDGVYNESLSADSQVGEKMAATR